jgi:branched-chain amino acid transport system ATP-binding protein
MSLLTIEGLTAGYGLVSVLNDVSLEVAEGEILTVIGSNGAGKSTLLRTISGLTDVRSGSIIFNGQNLVGRSPAAIGRAGIAHVPENRRVFPAHTVEDNLFLGAFVRRTTRREITRDAAQVYERFPVLGERRRQKAGTLSGGEQQMLAIGMALMARPKLVLLDEPSLGLAPIVVEQVFAAITELARSGMTILLVEQFARVALSVADRGIVLQLGSVTAAGDAESLRNDDAVRRAYLG